MLLEKHGALHNFETSGFISLEDQCKYKYMIDIEGHSASFARMEMIMVSGCLPFKHESPYKQYYEAGLEPYVHYVPVKRDFSDLIDQIQWARANDDKAQEIVTNAQKFASNYFRKDQLDNFLLNTFA